MSCFAANCFNINSNNPIKVNSNDMFRILIHTMLVLLVLTLSVITSQLQTHALPITSKPIKNTAENLAWQAWVMLPPEQKNLEKSRKVTPKSIFTLPFRECPPGHQLFQARCIPTVNIDQTALLTQQLLGFVVGGGNIDNNNKENNNYDFDYEDGGEEIVMYEPPQKLSGEGSGSTSVTFLGNYDDAPQLPAKDEPIKFNFFHQNFPTDYEADSSSPQLESDAKQANNYSNAVLQGMQFLEAVKGYLARHANETELEKANSGSGVSNNNNNNINNKFIIGMEGSGYTSTSTERNFGVNEFEAIALPILADNPTLMSDADLESHKSHKFSLFKDDSAVQLVMTAISESQSEGESSSKQPNISHLLKADALLPLLTHFDSTSNVVVSSTATRAETKNNRKTTAIIALKAVQSVLDEVTDMLPDDEVETTTKTTTTDLRLLLYAPEMARAQQQRDNNEDQQRKTEHIRSVTVRYKDEIEEELIVSTTKVPDDDEATTNIQLDETTIIETYDSPTAASTPTTPFTTVTATATSALDNRLYHKHESLVETAAGSSQQRERDTADGKIKDTVFCGTSTKSYSNGDKGNTTSKNNTAEELRMVNELVNGNKRRQLTSITSAAITENKSTTTTTTTTTAATTTTTTINTETEKTTTTIESSQANETEGTKTNPSTASPLENKATNETIYDDDIEGAAFISKLQNFGVDSGINSTISTLLDETVKPTEPPIEATATIWSKILPILTFGTIKTIKNVGAVDEISLTSTPTTLLITTTLSLPLNTAPTSPHAFVATVSSSNSFQYSDSSSRLDFSDASTSIDTSSISLSSISRNNGNKNSKFSENNKQNMLDAIPAIVSGSTTARTTATTSASEPFWWLPIGWRFNHLNNEETEDRTHPLLLRFWSAFPGGGQKGT